MLGAGTLRCRFSIQRNMAGEDWSGHQGPPDWTELLSVRAGIEFMRGSEPVIAARLNARQPAILTIRNSAAARGILPSDRAVNTATGEIFNIREKPRVARENRGFLQVLVESGVS